MLHAPFTALFLIQFHPDGITIIPASHSRICKAAAYHFIVFSFYLEFDGFHFYLKFFMILGVDYFDQWGDLRFWLVRYVCTTYPPGSTSPPRYDVGTLAPTSALLPLGGAYIPLAHKNVKKLLGMLFKNIQPYTLTQQPYDY